jgi:GntR family transcriptional regulator, transcriptional repressor for pyruvate dehydrogenase complex
VPSKDGIRQTRRLPSFQPAERKPISRVVFDQIAAEIRRGRLRPGDRLPTEQELVAAFKVSRSSVREALRGLATLGLIETRQGRGAIVALQAESPLAHATRNVDMDHLNRRALLDLLEVREALETKAASLAAQQATRSEIQMLRQLQVAVEQDVAEGRSYFRSNAAFHRGIAVAGHNPLLIETIEQVGGQVRAYRERLMREIRSMPKQDVREHRAIIDAIAAGNAERARDAVSAHLRSFARLVSAELPRDAA